MAKEFKARLLNLVEIDYKTKLLTVAIETERQVLWWTLPKVVTRHYIFFDGLWIDEDNLMVVDLSTCMSLQGMLIADEASKRLNRYLAIP